MRKFPFVKQHDLRDCGVACLLMITEYYKGYVPLEKLRELTHTTKNGTTAYHLVETAKVLGFNSYGIKVDNLDNIKLPCIAHVTINNSYNHYVVIYEIDYKSKELIIADPASRIKKISFNEFNSIFNNIILVFEKSSTITTYNKNINLKKYLVNILKQNKNYFIKIILISLFITIFTIITSFYIGLMINNINIFLFQIFYIFLSIYTLKNILEYIRNKMLLHIQIKLEKSLTNEIFESIISLPYRYFKNRTTGEVITRINDVNIINETIIKIIVTIILDMTISITASILLLIISLKLFIVCLLIFIIYLIIIMIFYNPLKINLENIKDERSKINSYIIENISGFETIKGLGIEKNIINKHHNINNDLIKTSYKYNSLYIMENFLKNITNDVGLSILILLCLLVSKNISLIITYSYLYNYFISPLTNIINLNKDIKEAKLSFDRINELLFNEIDNNEYKNIKFNKIKFNNLTFSYDSISNVINNINLEINNKEKIMVLGSSGSGKSTFLKLLKKYYQVEDNNILIDNIDINDISIKELNDNITYVSQNEVLFTDTLYNNLTLNRKVKNIDKVLDDTCIDFMDDLKLNMLIEENGFNLSGGQKSRVVLARSLLNNFKILILDEIFNEMDINLERRILKNLFNKYKNKTIIVVSHRKDNIDLFDRVIEIEEGKIKKDLKKHF